MKMNWGYYSDVRPLAKSDGGRCAVEVAVRRYMLQAMVQGPAILSALGCTAAFSYLVLIDEWDDPDEAHLKATSAN